MKLAIPASLFTAAILALVPLSQGQLLLSGNENKIDLTSGTARLIPGAPPDTLSILDFASFPPKVFHLDLPNTVLGPPSNIAISPDRSLALIANSIRFDPANPTNWIPHTEIHILDLRAVPPKVVGQVHAGQQPSGLSIFNNFALVANRADGTITRLQIDGLKVQATQHLQVCQPEESISDVAISPDGKFALATVQKGSYLALLHLNQDKVEFTGKKLSVYGQPYRVVISPDGQFAFTAGQGSGNGLDHDAVSIVDLTSNPPRTIDFVTIGASPESVEISPDGKLLAAVVMNGSNLSADNPLHRKNGLLEILARRGKSFSKIASIPIGVIPEGVAFTSDGKYLVLQCHPSRELWIFTVQGEKIEDTGTRIKVPGMPSSLRASP